MRRSSVYLCEPTPADETDFLEMVQASRSLHHPWVDPPRTPEAYRTAVLERAARPDAASFLVRRREDDALAGIYNISEIVRGAFQSAFLGYYGSAPLAGSGSMTEGLRLVVEQAFGPLDLHRLEANIQPGNDRSIALVRRCGFREEGFSPRYLKVNGDWRDHVRFAITTEDVQPS